MIEIIEANAPKRPKKLPCKIVRFSNKGEKWIAAVGLYESKPYEIFSGLSEKLNIPNSIEEGYIVRNKIDKTIFDDEEGIEKTVRWYLDHQDWMDNITSGEYEKYYEEMYKDK